MYFDRRYLKRHVLNQHGTLANDYIQQYGSFQSKAAVHKCKLCKRGMKWNVDSIVHHLKNRHGLSKTDYEKSFALDLYQPEIDQVVDPIKSTDSQVDESSLGNFDEDVCGGPEPNTNKTVLAEENEDSPSKCTTKKRMVSW